MKCTIYVPSQIAATRHYAFRCLWKETFQRRVLSQTGSKRNTPFPLSIATVSPHWTCAARPMSNFLRRPKNVHCSNLLIGHWSRCLRSSNREGRSEVYAKAFVSKRIQVDTLHMAAAGEGTCETPRIAHRQLINQLASTIIQSCSKRHSHHQFSKDSLKVYSSVNQSSRKMYCPSPCVAFVVCAILAAFTATGNASRQKRIIDGTWSKREDWPETAAIIVPFWDLVCGGVLVSDQWLLTAAHCVDSYKYIVVYIKCTTYRKSLEAATAWGR